MDFEKRLANLEERRGESVDAMLQRNEQETGLTVNDYLLGFAEALAKASPDETVEIIDNMGGMEQFHPYQHMNDGVIFFTGLESFSDGIVRIYDRIIAFIKRWLKVLADSDFKLSLTTGLHQTTLENLRTDMRTTARTQKKSPTFPVFTRIEGISVNYRPLTNSQALLNSLTVLRSVASLYFGEHDSSILRQVNQVVTAVNSRQSSQRIAEIMYEVSPKRLTSNAIMKLDVDQAISPHLLGNHRLVISNDDSQSSDKADQIHGIRIKMDRSQITNTNPVDVVQFQYFDLPMSEALLTKCDSILSILSESNTGQRRSARRQGMNALLACVERVRDETARGQWDDDESRRTVALLESYIAWIADPYTAMYAYMLRTVKATLNVVASNNA